MVFCIKKVTRLFITKGFKGKAVCPDPIGIGDKKEGKKYILAK